MVTPNDNALLEWIHELSAAGETTTLVLRRGDRWGWIGFHDGEVTSIRTTKVQGITALNLLVLWEDAELYGDEDASSDTADAEWVYDAEMLCKAGDDHLTQVATLSSGLDLLACYRQTPVLPEVVRNELGDDLTKVLALFDGERALVDVLEDSPYNMYWTLRAAKSLADADIVTPAA